MAEKRDTKHDPVASGSPNVKEHKPEHKGGNAVQNAEKWGGGSSGSKGEKSRSQNQNSSSKT